MKISFYCDSGSPIGIIPPYIYGRGVGGAELALICLAESLAKMGHRVVVYNDPVTTGSYDGVDYRLKNEFENNEDALIFFRTPARILNKRRNLNTRLKVFWSCDQYTVGNFGRDVFPFTDLNVCISPYHIEHFKANYGTGFEYIHIDLGVRASDYNESQPVARHPHRFIFCSDPNRGLKQLRAIWPRIKQSIPDAELFITFDYTLWGCPGRNTEHYMNDWRRVKGVNYLNAIGRKELVELQLSSGIHIYPCTYPELFCIAVAETQFAGAVPITSESGAVSTTNRYGYKLPGDFNSPIWLQDFADFVIESTNGDYNRVIESIRPEMMAKARVDFSWETIAQKWQHELEARL